MTVAPRANRRRLARGRQYAGMALVAGACAMLAIDIPGGTSYGRTANFKCYDERLMTGDSGGPTYYPAPNDVRAYGVHNGSVGDDCVYTHIYDALNALNIDRLVTS